MGMAPRSHKPYSLCLVQPTHDLQGLSCSALSNLSMASMQVVFSNSPSIPYCLVSKSPLDVKSFVKSGNEMFAKTSDGILTNCVGSLSESSEDAFKCSGCNFLTLSISTFYDRFPVSFTSKEITPWGGNGIFEANVGQMQFRRLFPIVNIFLFRVQTVDMLPK